MSDDILDTYDRLIESQAIHFEAITRPDDWHLTAIVRPSFQPETIYDLDHRAGHSLFYRTRFLTSAWSALFAAREAKGVVQPLSVVRACAKLPTDHPLVRRVAGEHLFRMVDVPTIGLDGTSYAVIFAYHGGALRLTGWEAVNQPAWGQLFEDIDQAVELLPGRLGG
jgi:hypothetical protein